MNIKVVCFIFSIFFTLNLNAQEFKKLKIVDSLIHIKAVPNCDFPQDEDFPTNSLYWRIASYKKDIIPSLIDKLDDNTKTKARVAYAEKFYTVADAALAIIKELVPEIPAYKLMGLYIGVEDCGPCVYWSTVESRPEIRKEFKHQVKNWYIMNEFKFKWVEQNEKVNLCVYENPLLGYFSF